MVGDKKNKKNKKTRQLGRNRGIPKTQLGFSLDQQVPGIAKDFHNFHNLVISASSLLLSKVLTRHVSCGWIDKVLTIEEFSLIIALKYQCEQSSNPLLVVSI